jgi:hypothetical protein
VVGSPSTAATIVSRYNDPHSSPNSTSSSLSDSVQVVWTPNYTGPFDWFYNEGGNKVYSTEATYTRLAGAFNSTHPNLVPTSTSVICFNGQHTFDPAKPINMDTTSSYANYNAPSMPPSFSDSKVADSFFDQVNYVGGFGYGISDWATVWTNFDPQNADYGDAY